MSFTNTAIAARLLAATAVCSTLIATPAFAAEDPKSVVAAEDPKSVVAAEDPKSVVAAEIPSVVADRTPEATPDQLAEIIVTAEKRPQNLQKTPISIRC